MARKRKSPVFLDKSVSLSLGFTERGKDGQERAFPPIKLDVSFRVDVPADSRGYYDSLLGGLGALFMNGASMLGYGFGAPSKPLGSVDARAPFTPCPCGGELGSGLSPGHPVGIMGCLYFPDGSPRDPHVVQG